MKTLKSLAALIVSVALISVAPVVAADDTGADSDAAQPAKVCIDTARIRNHNPLSDDHLLIEQSNSEYYLITMKASCFGMRNARVIAFKDTMRRICSDDNFADIIFQDVARPMTCRIGNIEAVADKKAAEALVAARKEVAAD